MDNVLIDDRRIHVDFSQSVSKLKFDGKLVFVLCSFLQERIAAISHVAWTPQFKITALLLQVHLLLMSDSFQKVAEEVCMACHLWLLTQLTILHNNLFTSHTQCITEH